jgi:hypothetical protein
MARITTRDLTLTGDQLALLSGASTVFAFVPFDNAAARRIRADVPSSRAEELGDWLAETAIDHFRSAGLWPREPWTEELIRGRANTSISLRLSELQAQTVAAALQATQLEYGDRWDEFCTVAPGNLQMYDIGPADLRLLATRLSREQTPP